MAKSYAEIFHRNPALAAPVSDASDDERGGTGARRDEGRRRHDSGGSGVPRTERSFQDVAEFRRKRRSLMEVADEQEPGPDETQELHADELPSREDDTNFEEVERPAPEADLADYDSELTFVAARDAENATGTPLPLPVRQPDGPKLGDEASSDAEDAPKADAPPAAEEAPDAEPDADSDEERDEPLPAAELATMPFDDWDGTIAAADVAGDATFDIRIDDEIEEDVGVERIVAVLKAGSWTDAVEIRDDDGWVELPEHPLVDRIHDYMVGQSRQIRLEATGGEPDDEVSPPPTPEQREASSKEDRDDSETASTSGEQADVDEWREQTSASPLSIAAVVVTLLAAAALAAVWYANAEDEQNTSSPPSEASAAAARPAEEESRQPEPEPEPVVFDKSEANPTGDAVSAARRAVRDGLAPMLHAEAYLAAEKFGPARRMAIRAMGNRGITSRVEDVYDAAIKKDERLKPETVTIGIDEKFDKLHALGGGWSLSFRFTRNGRTLHAFKPAQKHWEEGWRAEIAAYHFCEIVACHFDIPRNRPARISKKHFETLYGRVDDEQQRDYRERFGDLVWKTEIGPGGNEREYLYGTLKDWVPHFTKWPIEYEDVWRPWLEPETDPALLEQPLRKSLAPLKEKGEEDFFANIMDERGGATTRSTARQLSSLLVFDFLTSNWDRFSTAEKYYGVNNQYASGKFVSIDNGASFPRYHFQVVARRLEPVGRFSRQTILSIQALEPKLVDPILFPEPSTGERDRLETFWEQRDKLLDLVRAMRAEFGSRTVYTFR